MNTKKLPFLMMAIFISLLMGCAGTQPNIPVDEFSVEPGTSVALKGQSFKLLGTPIAVGKTLPSVELRDASTMAKVDLSTMRGSVLFLSIVPSLDTPVCDAQTHYLGEEGDKLSPEIKRITISRDTPFAQKRFAKEAKLADLQYLSDHGDASFVTHLPDMERAFQKAEELQSEA